MRGKLHCGIGYDIRFRITPAGAGKTHTQGGGATPARDHPRRCGENRRNAKSICASLGSPPQVRGKPTHMHGFLHPTGITPAGAGKTESSTISGIYPQDHPRRCGENDLRPYIWIHPKGSPPQVRGKLYSFISVRRHNRITPAGAGKTLKRSFRNQPFCSGAVQISFNFSNSLNVSLQSGSAR